MPIIFVLSCICFLFLSITGLFSLVVNIIVFVVEHCNIVLSIFNYLHVVSFHIPTLQMFVLTSGSLTRLVYQLFSDCQYQLFFVLIYKY